MYSSKPQEYNHMLNENIRWIFILATSIYAGVNSLLETEFSLVIGNPRMIKNKHPLMLQGY